MHMFAGILSNFTRKNTSHIKDGKCSFIFYKIVDSIQEDKEYILQCINTKAIFHAKIAEIVFDVDILYSLHPIQACYIGIEYSKYVSAQSALIENQNKQEKKPHRYEACRYGTYQVCFQDRKGIVGFMNRITGEEFLMDPRDIALSEELINEFDSTQSFHIGLLAGLKLNEATKRNNALVKRPPHLTLVK